MIQAVFYSCSIPDQDAVENVLSTEQSKASVRTMLNIALWPCLRVCVGFGSIRRKLTELQQIA